MSANPASFAHAQGRCASCNAELTEAERTYYGHSCEACERKTCYAVEQLEASGFSTSPEAPPVNQIGAGVNPDGAFVQPIRLVLPYPISANRYWRPVRIGNHITIVPTKEAKQYKADVKALAMQAGVRNVLLGRLALTVRLFPNRPLDYAKRARKDPDGWADTVQCIDLGNCEKVLSDALNGVAWTDDKQLHEIRLQRMDPDERGARVEVEIAPIVRQPMAPGLF